MGALDREAKEIHAKIVYYGPAEGGKTANLQLIHRKLKREHRGELKTTKVEGDAYEFLPVTLGKVRNYATSIHIYSVPGGPEHAALRREILEDTDGIVFVADLRPDRHEATLAAAAELREHLDAYGTSMDDVVLVTQYNQRDQVGETALDSLHKQLELKPAAHFEAVAVQGVGVLQTLTTLSKQILSNIRARAERPEPEDPGQTALGDEPLVMPPPSAAASLEAPTKGFRIEAAGPVEATDGEARIPFQLIDEASGRKVELILRLNLADS